MPTIPVVGDRPIDRDLSRVLVKPGEPQIFDVVQGPLDFAAAPGLVSHKAVVRRGSVARAVQQAHGICLSELLTVQTLIQTLTMEGGGADAQTLRRVAKDIETCVTSAHASTTRMAEVFDFGLNLQECSDCESLLQAFCCSVRDIFGARLAAVCMRAKGEGRPQSAISSVNPLHGEDIHRALNPTEGLLGKVLHEGSIQRFDRRTGDLAGLGLPEGQPPFDSVLAAGIVSFGVNGWFYLADALGDDGFSDEDQRLAATLAAQFGSGYSRLASYERALRDVSVLKLSAAARLESDARETLYNERQFRDLAKGFDGVLQFIDVATADVLYASPTYKDVWQRGPNSLYPQTLSWLDAIHPEDRARTIEQVADAANHGPGPVTLEYRIVRPAGDVRWIRSRGLPIRNEAGKVYRIASVAEDVTAQKNQELRILRLSWAQAMLCGINAAIVRAQHGRLLLDEVCRVAVDEGGFEMAWVAVVQQVSGCLLPAASRGIDQPTLVELAAYHLEGAGKRGAAMRAVYSRETVVVSNIRNVGDVVSGPIGRLALDRGCGSLVHLPLHPKNALGGVIVLYARQPNFFAAQEIALLEEIARDVSFAMQYVALEEKLDYLANYDSLTTLPNSMRFRQRLAQILTQRGSAPVALFLVDIDHFTQFNDSFGRSLGDQILSEVAKRLRVAVPEPLSVARISADTFAIVIPVLKHDATVGVMLHERIFGVLSAPFALERKEVRISVRAGVAVYPADGATAESLFTNAEVAVRQAKVSGARYVLYTRELNARVAGDLKLGQRLQVAWERREFVVHYQPQVAAKDGRIVGLEVLLRWQNPEAGLVPPKGFIGALEESELILDVGRWTLEQALADCRRWQQRGLAVPRIAVNVSAVQLLCPDFAQMVLEVMSNSGAAGIALELEITESVIMANIQTYIESLQKICDYGVSIAIDDFGTGSSSLRYLAQLPVETLKIDRSFIARMTNDSDSMTLVSVIISLAHSLDRRVIAEGVESEDHARLLKLMKCDILQGYLFGKPMPAHEIESRLGSGV